MRPESRRTGLAAAFVLLAACGRLGFEEVGTAGPDAGSLDASPGGDASTDGSLDAPVADASTADATPGPDAAPADGASTAVPPVPDPLAWYRMEAVTGGVADSAGNGHRAYCPDACPTADLGGRAGSALSLSGGPQHLRVTEDGSFRTAGGFTVGAWVRLRSLMGRTVVTSKPFGGAHQNSWAVAVEDDGRPFFYSTDGADTDFLYATTAVVPTDTWVHLAITWDGTTKTLYVNGSPDAARDRGIEFDDNDLVIGGDYDDGVFGFGVDGLLDEMLVYDRPLPDADVAALAGP